MRKSKRSYYVPGMLSLIILPLAFIYFAKQYYQSLAIQGIALYVSDNRPHEWSTFIYESYIEAISPKREYIRIELTGDNYNDKTSLEYGRLKIRQLVQTNDTTRGVHFIFKPTSTYQAFINAIDICRLENAKIFIPVNNNLWIFTMPPVVKDTIAGTPEIPVFICGTRPFREPPPKPTLIQKAFGHFINSWHIILSFTLLLFFAIRSSRKRD